MTTNTNITRLCGIDLALLLELLAFISKLVSVAEAALTQDSHSPETAEGLIRTTAATLRSAASCIDRLLLGADFSPPAAPARQHEVEQHAGRDAEPAVNTDNTNDAEPVQFRAGEATLMLRPRSIKKNPTDGKVVTAVNLDSVVTGDRSAWIEDINHWWTECSALMTRPDADWCKAGAVMWDHVRVEVPAEYVAFSMSLKNADADMVRASQAAIFTAIATTVGPVDYDTILAAVTIFVHTHPAFRDVVQEGTWRLPYGDSTAYLISNLGELEDDGRDVPNEMAERERCQDSVADQILKGDEDGLS
jgi:hypothetical protein